MLDISIAHPFRPEPWTEGDQVVTSFGLWWISSRAAVSTYDRYETEGPELSHLNNALSEIQNFIQEYGELLVHVITILRSPL